jgi:hypothetical protein
MAMCELWLSASGASSIYAFLAPLLLFFPFFSFSGRYSAPWYFWASEMQLCEGH